MRMTTLLGRTLRQPPVEAEVESHRLLVRAGYIRQVGAGLYSLLPLGLRVLRKVEAIVRDEMDRIGGQETLLPVLNPADLWKESGRWQAIGPELVRFADRAGRELVLAMTHEEVVADLARREISSYRQLPALVYQIQTKVRDEARPRGGLIRAREFVMKDAYSLHPDQADLDAFYPRMYQAYLNVFERVGVPALPVEADTGLIGGTGSHEFVVLAPAGEDTVIRCPSCGYAANVEKAVGRKDADGTWPAEEAGPELVNTPGVRTIDGLAAFFNLPAQCFLKSVFYAADGAVVVAAIRGDLDVNEAKLARALGLASLRLANEDELRSAGIVAGFASPAFLASGAVPIRIVVDDSVPGLAFVAGANQPDYHRRGVTFGRDFAADAVADIALAQAGQECTHCSSRLVAERAIELGHTFKLGTKYSDAMGADYLDASGERRPIHMGCYGIGLGRLIAAVVERHHDERGIVWPASIAPYQVHLCALGMDSPEVATAAELLDGELSRAGLQVLFDDRNDPPGVKFNDADLIGLPIRLVVSRRTVGAGTVEIKGRTARQPDVVSRDDVVRLVLDLARPV